MPTRGCGRSTTGRWSPKPPARGWRPTASISTRPSCARTAPRSSPRPSSAANSNASAGRRSSGASSGRTDHAHSVSPRLGTLFALAWQTRERSMSEIMYGSASPVGRRKPRGGWLAPALVVVVVALLASGVFSTDPEVDAAAPVRMSLGPVGAAADPANDSMPVVDDQADFVEFGFDSQSGVIAPRGEPAASAPTLQSGETQRPV